MKTKTNKKQIQNVFIDTQQCYKTTLVPVISEYSIPLVDKINKYFTTNFNVFLRSIGWIISDID